MMLDVEPQKKISDATEAIEHAERELQAALSELEISERADKRMISDRLRAACTDLREARGRLKSLIEVPQSSR